MSGRSSRWIQPLGSDGCTGSYGERALGDFTEEEEESDEEDAFISFEATESRCERLYQHGLELKLRGNIEQSLSSFLGCMEGMQECQYFARLPQTLHQLAELYNSLECYDKALEYAKAEKLFYEAVLIDSQKTNDGGTKTKSKRRPFSKKSKPVASPESNPAEYGNLLIKKAEEFERLAQVCAEEKKFEIALDYCGKATNIRQSVFGPNHQITLASLEYFTLLYAEVGKHNYSEALHEQTKRNENFEEKTNISIKGDLSQSDRSLQGAICRSVQDNSNPDSPQCSLNSESNVLPSSANPTQSKTIYCMENSKTSEDRKVEEVCASSSFPPSHSETSTVPASVIINESNYHSQECNNNYIEEKSRLDKLRVQDAKVAGHCPYQEVNVCTGMKNNLTKLSLELKAPMCVNLDIHNAGSGGSMEHAQCVPLWVLLLPAFLALVAYLLYYH